MSERERNPWEYVLTDVEREQVFADRIVPQELAGLREASQPTVRYIGAQPGAGKSSLQTQISSALEQVDGPGSVVEINNDAYRVYHPRYIELRARDEETASFYTNDDCNYWIGRSLMIAFDRHPHILLESSLRKPQEVLDIIGQGHQRGFGSALDVVVANEFESRLSIAERYLNAIEQTGAGRYVLRQTHDESYQALPDTLQTLAGDDGFQVITLYARTGQVLHRHLHGRNDPAELGEVYLLHRATPTQSYEQLLTTVDRQIERAQRFEREACLTDLWALRSDLPGC